MRRKTRLPQLAAIRLLVADLAISKCRGSPPAIFYPFHQESPLAEELSIFVDESGDRGGKARYYLLTLVFRDQADSIAEAVTG